MDELTLVAGLRDDVPGPDLAGPRHRLADEIFAAAAAADAVPGVARAPRGRPGRTAPGRRRRRVVVAGALAAAAAVAAATVIIVASRPAPREQIATAPQPPAPSAPGPAATSAQLVAYATRAAAAAPPFNPKPGDWIYFKFLQATSSKGAGGMLFGPPDGKAVEQNWTPVSEPPGGGIGGWPDSSYPYLESLPSNPAKLTVIIEAGLKAENYVIGSGPTGVFNAVQALLESKVLPPRLLAALYGVLAHDPAVHFDPRVADFAGQTGVAFYTHQEGYLKEEIVINPKTYAYMGDRYVAYRAHDLPAAVTNGIPSGPYTHYKKGQILAEEAVLDYGIVAHRGQVP